MPLKFEVKRQIFHICTGITFILLISLDILNPLRIFIILIAGIMVSLLSKKIKIPIVYWFLERFERKNEQKEFPGKGIIYFFVGVLLVLKLFPKNIALASIVILTFGDSISHLVGMRIGKIKHPLSSVKLVEGTLVGTLCAFVGALFFVPPLQALLGSIGAMTAEVVEFEMNKKPVDDNFIVPLVAGTIMLIVRLYL